ncbi:radical SAM protein [Halobacteriovorax marinus]|uniref:radical SAM protein n=1 Tax=Halobacteriovorax marinus TaxID=97084 RepID=UPI003A95AF15
MFMVFIKPSYHIIKRDKTMYDFPIEYDEPVFRPPSEGRSFLLQVTIGCSHNLCTYCNMYRSKKYRERELLEIEQELKKTHEYFQRLNYSPRRVFLCDGDALGASMDILRGSLRAIKELFPSVERVGVYATAQNMLDKSQEELEELKELGLSIAYLGLESGNDKVLHRIVKGNTAQNMIDGCEKLHLAGWDISIIGMLGIGGREFSKEHIADTAEIISKISPKYFSLLTTVAVRGTPLKRMVERGQFNMLTTKELTREMREIISNIEPSRGEILFRANHVSNQFPLGGSLKRDTSMILETLDEWLTQIPDGIYPETPQHML